MNNKKKLLIIIGVVILLVVVVKANNHINTYHLSKEDITEFAKRDGKRYIESDYFKLLDVYEDDKYRIVTYRLSKDDKYGHFILEQDFRGKYKVSTYSLGDGYFSTRSLEKDSTYYYYIIGNNKFNEVITMKLQTGDELITRKIKPGYFVIPLEIERYEVTSREQFTFLNEKNKDVTRSIIYE